MSNTGFSISDYHDIKPIYKKLDHLVSLPLQQIKPEAMENYMDYYKTKCTKSRAIYEDAQQYIPGGVQHNLAFNYPFPLAFTKAEGAHLFDADGNKYIDFLQAGGPTVLGSNYPLVREKAIELINECGPSTGLLHEYEYKLAELICRNIPSVERFRMLGSGTEAVMGALRLARIKTGNKKIIKIGGAYHGWSDQMVYDLRIPGTRFFDAKGIPFMMHWHTQAVPPNDIDALESTLKWNRLRGGTAAVILEPLGPESGTYPVYKEFAQQARDLCDKYGALLIFDEVVTAFRVGMSGAQGYFNVKPDLTIFGKVVAGGYPSAGGIGGKAEYMDGLAAGLQGGKKVKVGGTMAANPLSCCAGYYTLLEIEKTNACEKAGKAGDRITKGLNLLIDKYELPFVAFNQGSICHLETAGTLYVKIKLLKIKSVLAEINQRKKLMEEYGAAYMAEGIVTLAGSRLYMSMADTDEVVDDALNRFENVFRNVKK
ncbi:MAG: aminotransferase class III-fold pyridoxal phosphate-dependent enzyme [Bacteroidetes bacterium]|jgi:glutamate-1-semialdehyde 2,1-aminomutase|nr:aminotransferase class III-fold pyridoxal phosphate-dependent enzyme [Bacteroidota bacterium]MBK9635789.1 aminotransferase class III-fold pyridoxal phosphate-dependent enzyme [Bacteroidota bacterium]MBL0077795.1 aminotransferase class III-fold pyridoxal phosphate-dependent enzyme [Bacteroidota bacterium]MBL0288008.1 aminotransferase class III-fold pyridoxal phosphate-dependent enzyme [Bacteroidota bacterium]MBP7257373.1 aminotransferase class III-fold pyridoxal phosphate-dependent enzyme [Ch